MKTGFVIFLSVFGLAAMAQVPPNVMDYLILQATRPTSAAASWSPTNITQTVLYLDYHDLPSNARPDGWTNEMSSVVFTNQGASLPTNSSSGVYFPGTAGNYFVNGASGINFVHTTNSMWIHLSVKSITDSYNSIVSDDTAAGAGLYASTGNSGLRFYSVRWRAYVFNNIPTNTDFDIAICGDGVSTTNLLFYTNGVLSTNVLSSSTVGNATTKCWGIGRDNDADTLFNGWVKRWLITSNYVFSSTDISNLHYYATSNP